MKSPVTRVNEALKRAGRAERVIRARGYYRLHDGDSHRFKESGLYALGGRMLDATEEDFNHLLDVVKIKFEENGVEVTWAVKK